MAEGSGSGFGSPSHTGAAPLLFGQPISEPLNLGPPAVAQASLFGVRVAPPSNSASPSLTAPGPSGFGQASLSGLSPFQLAPFDQFSAQAAATSSGFTGQWSSPSARPEASNLIPFAGNASPTLFELPPVPSPLSPPLTFPAALSLFGTGQSSLPTIGSGTVFGKPSDGGGTVTPDVMLGKGQSGLPDPAISARESGGGGAGTMSNRHVDGQDSLSSPSNAVPRDGIKDLK